MAEGKQLNWISGFWRRIGAFVIDGIILGLIGMGLGLFLETLFVEIGVWGRFIGFVIALLYFGVMNSEVANGQTLGKKLLKIRVVSSGNKPIGIIKSFARYSILGVPFFLNGAQFSDETMFSFWLYILAFIVFGGLFSTVYLYVFNRVTRQSLHDLVVNTYVVNDTIQRQPVGQVWKPHLVITSLFFIAAAIVPVYTASLAQQQPFSELLNSRESIMSNPSVNYATVSYGATTTSTVKTGTTGTTHLSAQVFLKNNDISNIELANKLANSLLNNYSSAKDKDLIIINLVYGYDIGIASRWDRHSYRFNPKEINADG